MSDPSQWMLRGGRAPGQPPVVYAQVSRLKPLPASFADPLYVVIPYDPDNAIRVTNWPAIHGATLPAGGADVVLVHDDQHNWRVVWWDGVETSGGASGPAGGALSGTYPNPALAIGTVLQLAATGTNRKAAFGQTTLTWSASSLSAAVTVTHGLGVTPQISLATVNSTTTFLAYAGCDTLTSTTFKLQAQAGSSVTISVPASWLVIG